MIENDVPQEDSSARLFLPLLLVLFACSGCSALIYEIVWYQLLQFVIGSTAISLGVLLATFMGGLGLGSIALPRILAARRHHPLRVYGAIELGIGICGILVLFGMPLVSRIYVVAAGHGFPAILLRGAICSICLLPPTTLMGASLPAIARWIKTNPKGISRLGLLYSANTAGAMFGCLLAGFYLLRVYDMAIATYVAVAVNMALALISFVLASSTSLAAADAPTPERIARSLHDWPVLVSIAVSGTCALGAEIVWTRILSLILGGTVYTFSIILAVFLMGLGAGGYAGALLSRLVRPRMALIYCQLLLTTTIAWTAYMVSKSIPYWPINPQLPSGPWITFQLDLVRAIWATFPATVLWGASFPLALAAVATSEEDPARLVARVYAANTAGAILGALTFSIILIPHFGTKGSQAILILLSAFGALLLMATTARSKAGPSWMAAATIGAVILVFTVPRIPAEVFAYGRLLMVSPHWQILYVGEGLNASIAVSQFNNNRQFHVSGKTEASTMGFDMRMQRMLGDLPALIHPRPRSVLVVGFGAGATAGSFVVNPDVQRIVICEIESLIPRVMSRYFNKENYDVLHDPRTEVVYEDARNYILTTREKFDIITSDPIHPWVKGSAGLYTKEYFEMVKEHLNPGGVVTQWVPLYETDLETVRSEVATFFDVFPNGTIWANERDARGYDIVLLGQVNPTRVQMDELQQRLDRPEFSRLKKSLDDVGLHSALDLVATYAGAAPELGPWLEGAKVNRDRNLRLQYLAGFALNTNTSQFIYATMLHYRRFPVNLFAGSDQSLQAIHHLHVWE